MKTKIEFKDVAHLYLGCRLKCSQVFYPEKSSKDKDGNLILSASLMADFDDRIFSINDFKPILRPLSSLTPAECEVIGCRFSFIDKLNHVDHEWNVNDVLFLLKQGVDIFNLIQSGEAIDKTKI